MDAELLRRLSAIENGTLQIDDLEWLTGHTLRLLQEKRYAWKIVYSTRDYANKLLEIVMEQEGKV